MCRSSVAGRDVRRDRGWAATLGLIGALIAFGPWHSHRHPRAIGIPEAARWSVFYAAVAVLFGVALALLAGWDVGAQYFAGYIVEKSLSADNLFVFVLIMSTFAVPAERQAKLLMTGIVGALVLRTVFIAIGAAMLRELSFTYLVFGMVLTATAVQLFGHRGRDPSFNDNVLVAAARRRGVSPALLALLAIASTDVVFAFDSIGPAPWTARDRSTPTAALRRAAVGVDRSRIVGHVDRVLLEDVERHGLERPLMRGGEDDERGDARLVGAQPRVRSHAPAVARLESGKAVVGRRGAQIVADALLILEEFLADDGANRVAPEVGRPGAAAAVAVEARERIGAADGKRATEHVALHRPAVLPVSRRCYR
jgi:hypothetical protein